MSSTVCRGFSDEIGSWKIIWMLGAAARSSLPPSWPGRGPRAAPDRRWAGELHDGPPVVDLPHPDSPTNPSVSPGARSKETSVTAWTVPCAARYSTDEVVHDEDRCASERHVRVAVPVTMRPSSITSAAVARSSPAGALVGLGGTSHRASMAVCAPAAHRVPAPVQVIPGPSSTSAGSSAWHRAGAAAPGGESAARLRMQEVRRMAADARQPANGRVVGPAGTTRAAPRCRACGCWGRAGGGRLSTIRPAYITAISSAPAATTPRSWVIRSSPCRGRAAASASRSRICACTVTSRAVVGSSAIRSCGPQASAMAMPTRWRMPPDSWCGYWPQPAGRARGCRPSAAARWRVAGAASGTVEVLAEGLGQLGADLQHRVERGHRVLEDHRDLRPHSPHRLGGGGEQSRPS